jgi:hypothetical protein
MLVDRSCHVVVETFTDDWQNMFEAGDVIIRGYWYEKLRAGSRSYHLRTDKPVAHILSCSVVASKFSMPPTLHFVRGSLATYELSVEAFQQISDAVDKGILLDAD